MCNFKDRSFRSLHGLVPIERVGPRPWIPWPKKPIASPNEVIRRRGIVSRIRDHRAPSISSRLRLHSTHQSKLEIVTHMAAHNSNATEISGIVSMRRRNQARKRNRGTIGKSEPPVALIKVWNGCCVKERETMKVRQGISDILILPVDGTDSIHVRCAPLKHSHRS